MSDEGCCGGVVVLCSCFVCHGLLAVACLLTTRGHACVYVWSAYRRHYWTRCGGWYQRWWTKNLSSCTSFLLPLPSNLSMTTRLVASPLCAMHPCICRECNRSGFNSDIDQVTETTARRPMPSALRALCMRAPVTVPLAWDAGRGRCTLSADLRAHKHVQPRARTCPRCHLTRHASRSRRTCVGPTTC